MTAAALAPRAMLGGNLAALDRITTFEREVMAQLDGATESELLRACVLAKTLGGSAWRIECKAHARLLEVEQAKRGRGNKDVDGVGVKAAARELALKRGCHPSTIMRDAQIYRELLQNSCSDTTILEDKTFYVIALAAHNPHKALKKMARKKRKRSDFSTREARSLVEEMNAGRSGGRRPRPTPDVVRAHLDFVQKTIKEEFIANAPSSELIKRYYDDWRDDIIYERDRSTIDDERAAVVHAATERGARTADAIATAINKPVADVKRIVRGMIDEGQAEWVKEGGETEAQKGTARRQLLRFRGESVGNQYARPQTSSHYGVGEDEDDDVEL